MNFDRMLLRPATAHCYPELERLICAAAINPDLAAQLLADPTAALALPGYDFQLSPDERDLVMSIKNAADISIFASRLYDKIQQATDRLDQRAKELFLWSGKRTLKF